MTLRTPNPFLNARSALDLQRVKERMSILGQQIASGKRIIRPGDDPTGAALLVDFRGSIERNEQYLRQIDSASSFLQSAESAFQGVSDLLARTFELSVQAGGPQSQALLPELRGIRAQIISLANGQEQGKYLFAGTQTQTQPFSDATVNPTTYSGDSGTVSVDYNVGASVVTNFPGNAVFFGSGGQGSATDVFTQMSNLITATGASDTVGIKTALDNLNNIFQGVQQQMAEVGGRQRALEQMEFTLGNMTVGLQAIQETYEAVDYPQAVSEYKQADIVQQAALSMMGKSFGQNLFNFLG